MDWICRLISGLLGLITSITGIDITCEQFLFTLGLLALAVIIYIAYKVKTG